MGSLVSNKKLKQKWPTIRWNKCPSSVQTIFVFNNMAFKVKLKSYRSRTPITILYWNFIRTSTLFYTHAKYAFITSAKLNRLRCCLCRFITKSEKSETNCTGFAFWILGNSIQFIPKLLQIKLCVNLRISPAKSNTHWKSHFFFCYSLSTVVFSTFFLQITSLCVCSLTVQIILTINLVVCQSKRSSHLHQPRVLKFVIKCMEINIVFFEIKKMNIFSHDLRNI